MTPAPLVRRPLRAGLPGRAPLPARAPPAAHPGRAQGRPLWRPGGLRDALGAPPRRAGTPPAGLWAKAGEAAGHLNACDDFLGQLAPRALIHGEINPANARQADDGTLILLDWEEAGSAHPALEYGYPLILGFISAGDHAVDEDSAAAFYHAYASTGATTDPGLAFDAALFHALRHLWWDQTGQRWHRILFALKNEAGLRDLVR